MLFLAEVDGTASDTVVAASRRGARHLRGFITVPAATAQWLRIVDADDGLAE